MFIGGGIFSRQSSSGNVVLGNTIIDPLSNTDYSLFIDAVPGVQSINHIQVENGSGVSLFGVDATGRVMSRLDAPLQNAAYSGKIATGGSAGIVLRTHASQSGPIVNYEYNGGSDIYKMLKDGGEEYVSLSSSSANVDPGEYRYILCDTSSNGVTVDLPALSGVVGRIYTIKNLAGGSNSVTIDGNSSETIDGSATLALSAGEYATIYADSSDWVIIG